MTKKELEALIGDDTRWAIRTSHYGRHVLRSKTLVVHVKSRNIEVYLRGHDAESALGDPAKLSLSALREVLAYGPDDVVRLFKANADLDVETAEQQLRAAKRNRSYLLRMVEAWRVTAEPDHD